jgi:hypothetical protein
MGVDQQNPRNGGDFRNKTWTTKHGKHVNFVKILGFSRCEGIFVKSFWLPGGATTKMRGVKLFKVYHVKSLGPRWRQVTLERSAVVPGHLSS